MSAQLAEAIKLTGEVITSSPFFYSQGLDSQTEPRSSRINSNGIFAANVFSKFILKFS